MDVDRIGQTSCSSYGSNIVYVGVAGVVAQAQQSHENDEKLRNKGICKGGYVRWCARWRDAGWKVRVREEQENAHWGGELWRTRSRVSARCKALRTEGIYGAGGNRSRVGRGQVAPVRRLGAAHSDACNSTVLYVNCGIGWTVGE